MNILLPLIQTDIKEIFSWFKKDTIGKLFVVGGFLGVFLIIVLIVSVFTEVFFRTLASYESFGRLSVRYLFHAGVLLLFCLITLLSSFSFITFIFSSRRKIENLLVLPLPQHTIILWYFIKNAIMSFFLFSLFLFPFVFSFYRHFLPNGVEYFLLLYLMVVAIISIFSTTIGSLSGFLFLKGYAYTKNTTILGSILFLIVCSFLLYQTVFPATLKLLYNASPEQFETIYYGLPLTSSYLPTLWIVRGLIEQNIYVLLPYLTGAILFSVIVLHIMAKNFISLFQKIQSIATIHPSHKTFDTYILKTHVPILYKDWLSISRVPQEIGYAGFLLILVSLFFLFITYSQRLSPTPLTQRSEIIVFYFISLLFFATAYTLRIIFPLMAREGKQRWYLFTLPIHGKDILHKKIILGVLLIIPYGIFSFLVWHILAIPFGGQITVYSLFLLLCIAILNACTGAIYPNFQEAENAEKVSTSSMGIVSLILSLLVIGIGSYYLHQVLQQSDKNWISSIPAVVIISLITGSMYVFSLKQQLRM